MQFTDDVFNVPKYCVQSLANPILPTLSPSFSSVIEITDLNQKFTSTYYTYWDYEGNIARIDYRIDVDNVLSRFIDVLNNRLYYYYSSDQSCTLNQVPIEFIGPVGTLKTFAEYISFGDSSSKQFMGGSQRRGMDSQHWQGIGNSLFSNGTDMVAYPVTSDMFFTLPTMENPTQIPQAALIQAKPSSLYNIDMEFVDFEYGRPSSSLFAMPASCIALTPKLKRTREGEFRNVVPMQNRGDRGDRVDTSGYFNGGVTALISVATTLAGLIVGFVVGAGLCYILFVKSIQLRKNASDVKAPPVVTQAK